MSEDQRLLDLQQKKQELLNELGTVNSLIQGCKVELFKARQDLAKWEDFKNQLLKTYHEADRELAMIDGRFTSEEDKKVEKAIEKMSKEEILNMIARLERKMK